MQAGGRGLGLYSNSYGGSGGGSFFGTQTVTTDGSTGLVGFYYSAPIISVRSSVPDRVDLHWISNFRGSYDVSQYEGKVFSDNHFFYISNMIP